MVKARTKTIKVCSIPLHNLVRLWNHQIYKNNNKMKIRNISSASSPVVPVKAYINVDTQSREILVENKGLSGIYKWTNKINGKIYIGSSQNISKRFSQYSNPNYLERNTSMPICRALLKHGYENFDFSIIEYCEVQDLMDREEYYLNIL
jgi:hypothetical protein